VLVLAICAAGGWWWLHRRTPAPDGPAIPAVPAGITDPAVEQALETARQRVQAEPGSAVAWGNYGLTLLAHAFNDEADRCFVEAARLDPDNPLWPSARGFIVVEHDSGKALSFFRAAAALAPAGPPGSAYRLALAESLLDRRELAEAERLFREEWEASPGDLRAALRLGQMALERGDDRAAEELLTAARNGPSTRKQATGLLAALARRRHADADADALEKDAAGLGEDAPPLDPVLEQTLPRQVGLITRFQGLPELEAAARLDPRRNREIAELYLRDIKRRPTAHAYAYAGLYLFRAGDVEAALPLVRKGVGLDPDSALAHELLGQVLFGVAGAEAVRSPGSERAREWCREAVEHARRATELSPGLSRAYLVWGRALLQLGEPAAAVAPLRKGVSCEPGFSELQLALGEALLDTGKHQEAEKHLENARRLFPQDPRVAKALERLRPKKD
jgi:tetratricopeptide (TPR) repeat protein